MDQVIKSLPPVLHNCALPYISAAVWRYFKQPTHNWPPTTSPRPLVPGDVRGSLLHSTSSMQLAQERCPQSEVMSSGNNLHLHWEMYGAV